MLAMVSPSKSNECVELEDTGLLCVLHIKMLFFLYDSLVVKNVSDSTCFVATGFSTSSVPSVLRREMRSCVA